MAGSNSEWGKLAEHDTELSDAWDGYARLPEPGVSAALDAFVAAKHITIGSLVRLGARMADDYVIAFAYGSGVKFRDIVSNRKWSYPGSEWREMKIVRGLRDGGLCIIAEGETDGARLSGHYEVDVFVMPAGAGYFPDTYAAQVAGYKRVLVALDRDNAGERGATKIAEMVPHAERFMAPLDAVDWCEATELPPIPPEPESKPETKYWVTLGEMMDTEPPELESYFEDALLPVGGQMVIHGWIKSFKSMSALDLMAALAQGTEWATFQSITGPVKVAVVQFEVQWAYYRKRWATIMETAVDLDLLRENVIPIQPFSRPHFIAGNAEEEDRLLTNVQEAGAEVVLIDPIRRALGVVDINSSKEIRPILQFAERLSNNGIASVLVHHDNKASSRAGGGSPINMTGAGDFAGDCDSIVSIAVPRGMTERDPNRNLFFTLRNAPSPSARGMQMANGHLTYQQEPYGDGMDEGDAAPGPSI